MAYVRPYEPFGLTLDISDSLVKVNGYSLAEEYGEFFLIDPKDGVIKLPIFCGCGGAILPVVDIFNIEGDTLSFDNGIVEDCYSFTPARFVKGDINQCKGTHTLDGHLRMLKLSKFPLQTSNFIDLDSLRSKRIVLNLAVGYPVNKIDLGSSPRILVNDVLIDPSDVADFVAVGINRPDSGRPVALALIVDEEVPESYVDSVFINIPDTVSSIYQHFSSKNGKELGYQRVNGSLGLIR